MYSVSYVDAEGVPRSDEFTTYKFANGQAKFMASQGAKLITVKGHWVDLYELDTVKKEIRILAKNILLSRATRAAKDFMMMNPEYGIMALPTSERKRRQG